MLGDSASQLLEIIETIANFQIEDAPNSNTGDDFSVFRSKIGEIVIARQPNGEWLFTKETIRSVPLIVGSINETN